MRWARCCQRAPVDRRPGAAEAVRLRGAEARYLPRCARGEISAFLLTEPDVGSDPARLHTTATPPEDGSEYVLDGVKLWTTNGVVADAARRDGPGAAVRGHRGGITAFVVEADAPGITVEHRNAFMGLRGLENGVTRLHQCPGAGGERDRQGRAGPEDRADHAEHRPAVDPGDVHRRRQVVAQGRPRVGGERVQWGRPIGQHEAVANKIAFIAATAFALEAVLDLSAHLADEGSNDIRIEAALAKL